MGKLSHFEPLGWGIGSGVAVGHVSDRHQDRYSPDSRMQYIVKIRLTDFIVPECARPVLPVMMLLELCSVSLHPPRDTFECRDLLKLHWTVTK
jgi:hypothetical protein